MPNSASWKLDRGFWPPKLRECGLLIAAAACGAGAFLLVVGTIPLDVRNISWMQGGDLSQYYLGWSFFRRHGWASPPSLNPDFGLEIATTIFFVDIVPILALPAKFVAPASGPWQYHGWWLLICFILQAVFATMIARLFLENKSASLLVGVFSCFAPVFLLRAGMHLSLAGQWLILAALLVCLRRPPPNSQTWAWAALSCSAALVHSYILAMVMALWVADFARRAIRHARPTRLAIEVVLIPCIAAGALWLAGFRVLDGGGLAQGRFFGQFQTDVLGLFDPRGWSWVTPAPRRPEEAEGFGFAGISALVLIAAAIVTAWRRGIRGILDISYIPMVAVVVGLAIFSLSHRILVARQVLFEVPVPEFVLSFGELFRASERFFWPAYYLLILGSAVLVARHLPGRRAVLVLAAAVLVQAADTAPGWLRVRETFQRPGTVWPTTLRHPFWAEAGGDYRVLRRIPAQSHPPGWSDLAYFALVHGMPTDIVYLARFSFARLGALRAEGQNRVATARFDNDTLYILDDDMARLALATVNPERDLLARIDGHNVLAPGWIARRGMPLETARLSALDLLPVLRRGEALEFAAGKPGTAALREGWSTPEGWGVWSDGESAVLAFWIEQPENDALTLRIEGRVLVTPAHPIQRFDLSFDDEPSNARQFSTNANRAVMDFPLHDLSTPTGTASTRLRMLRLAFPDAIAPSALGVNDDRRRLGLGLERIRVLSSER